MPVGFQLPGGKAIADHDIECELERLEAVEKFLIDRFKQSEVRFVVDHHHIGRGFVARFCAFQFDVILIRHQIGRHEHATMGQNGAERALRERRLLLPRPKVIERLAGHVDPD